MARSGPPRAMLWRAASSSEPSSVGRMIDWSSESGFSIRTTLRRGWSCTEQQPVEQRGLGEAPADDLVQAAADERVLGAAAHPLGVRETARRRRGARAA